jgi:hypothetical protein
MIHNMCALAKERSEMYLAPWSHFRGVSHHLDLLSRLLRHLCEKSRGTALRLPGRRYCIRRRRHVGGRGRLGGRWWQRGGLAERGE